MLDLSIFKQTDLYPFASWLILLLCNYYNVVIPAPQLMNLIA